MIGNGQSWVVDGKDLVEDVSGLGEEGESAGVDVLGEDDRIEGDFFVSA